MTRLPGHWLPRFEPVNATAQTIPSRLITVAHMSRLKPPLESSRAMVSADLSCAWVGKPAHALLRAEPVRAASDESFQAKAGVQVSAPAAAATIQGAEAWIFMVLPFLASWFVRKRGLRPRSAAIQATETPRTPHRPFGRYRRPIPVSDGPVPSGAALRSFEKSAIDARGRCRTKFADASRRR